MTFTRTRAIIVKIAGVSMMFAKEGKEFKMVNVDRCAATKGLHDASIRFSISYHCFIFCGRD